MQLLKTPLTDQRVFSTYFAGSGKWLSVLLVLFSLVIAMLEWSPVIADETNTATQVKPDDARFYKLVSSCLDCHAIDNTSLDYVGPTLKGIVGRRVASVSNYGYSAALYQKAAIGQVWDEPTLDRFLKAPQLMAPGIAMTFSGIADPDERARLIAWLASGPESLDEDALMAAAQRAPEIEAVLQVTPDAEYGKYLAGTCMTCHFAPGASGSVPPITGLPADYFVRALLEYKQGERSNRIMQVMSEPLGVEEMAALATYFTQSAQ